MRLLVDQDIYKITIDHLREWGHNILTAKELGLQQVPDSDLLPMTRQTCSHRIGGS